jgi:hypothetical protein
MPVTYMRQELTDLMPVYELIADTVVGSIAVKKKGRKYLPDPSPLPITNATNDRYDKYVKRAVFYNVTKRTLNGLVGQIYLRDPVVELPTMLDPVHWDATGGGISLEQLSKEACRKTIAYGRSGIFVDYPKTDGPATRAQIDEGRIRPMLFLYHPAQIINWRVDRVGSEEFLSLVVLQEEYVTDDDGFMQTRAKQWRVLRINEAGNYVQEIYKDKDGNKPSEVIPVVDAANQPLKEIPFMFIGSENNTSEPDNPPMYDLAELNIGHYRNSADYEESCFIVGQPTPFLTGLTTDWIKDVLKGEILLGSRAAIALPVGGEAGLLQAVPNSMPFEAMQHKERQMVALGAKIVEQRAVQRTATEATQDEATELSTLASVAQNVGSAFTKALEWCAKFVGVTDSSIKFELNSEFDLVKMSPEDRRQVIEEWQSGAIAWSEMRENLRRGGIATMDDKEARRLIDEELGDNPLLNPRQNQGTTGGDPAGGKPTDRFVESGQGLIIEKRK